MIDVSIKISTLPEKFVKHKIFENKHPGFFCTSKKSILEKIIQEF